MCDTLGRRTGFLGKNYILKIKILSRFQTVTDKKKGRKNDGGNRKKVQITFAFGKTSDII